MSNQNESPFARLPEVQELIRRAVEERNYPEVLSLVEEQEAMFLAAGREHPDLPRFARSAHELNVWALATVRLQRSHAESAIHKLYSMKRVTDSYGASVDPPSALGGQIHVTPLMTQG